MFVKNDRNHCTGCTTHTGTQAHRQSAEGQRRTLWRWVSILPRESCRQFVHKRHNQPLIRQSLAFESPSTFPWIVSICPWNLVKGLRHPLIPPKKTNERQNIRLTRFVFPERDRSASKLLQSWLQSPHLSTNVKASYSFSLGSAMMSNTLVLTTCIGHCIKRATEKIQSIKVHLAVVLWGDYNGYENSLMWQTNTELMSTFRKYSLRFSFQAVSNEVFGLFWDPLMTKCKFF